jgi:aryl-alcohol dehydrogenase-like predicted oxidoreductase
LLRAAVDAGIDHIDTADAYGPETAEHLIRKALHPYPAHVLIATKGGLTRPGPNRWERCGRPEYLRQAVSLSLRRLKTDHLPLYYLHRIDDAVPLADQLGALSDMQTEGKIGHIGISQVTTDQLRHARQLATIAAVQNRYHRHDPTSRDVLEQCAATDTPFIAHSPLGQGAVLTETTVSSSPPHELAALLQHSNHIAVIPGTRSVTHLRQNLQALSLAPAP